MRGLIPLVLFALLIAAFAVGLSRDPAALPSEMIDRPAPEFTLPSLFEDKPAISDDVFKGRISLLNVFGSWCAACVTEHGQLIKIGASKRVQLIGVDWRDTRPAGQAWLARYGNPYDKVIFDESSLLAIDLGITGAPETFLIGPAGSIRHKHVGIITEQIWQEDFLPRIKKLKEGM